ncbi:MAG: TPM domain-containing protein [Candidatus Rokubacteria bacterium]|nr:TPM domain-containing protein [Candidatus Rokubacteria bacterium]MBI3826451.1 TPM domain-containing protein [Candidatus Rokubacteria bacterium]
MHGHPRWIRRVFSDEDLHAIAAAIARAERGTAAEIRVHVERRAPTRGDALARARAVFAHLQMHDSEHRNGVLIYLALEDRRLAIVGDAGIHQRVGDEYWTRIRDVMVTHMKSERARDAVIEAVGDVGRVLADHFPRATGDGGASGDHVSVGR